MCTRLSDAFREMCQSEALADHSATLSRNPFIHIGGRPSQVNNQEAGKVFEERARCRGLSCGCYSMSELIP